MKQRDSIKLTQEEAGKFLEAGQTISFATNGPGGYPHLVSMSYALQDGKILMTTYAKSQKVVNLRRDPKAAVLLAGC